MRILSTSASLAVSVVLIGLARGQAPTVEVPADRLDLTLGDPLSARALVTKPLPMTGVMGWSLETRRHRGGIWYHALSPDGHTLATGGLDGTIRLWDVETGRLQRALIGHNSYVGGLDWSPDGNTLASPGTYDITLRLWDTRSGRPLRILKGHPAEVSLARWAPNGRTVVAAGGFSGALSSWNVLTGYKRGTVELGQPILHMSWHPDSKSLALVCQTTALQIWDPDKNKVARSIGTAGDGYVSVAWSPDGKTLAAGTGKNTILFDGESGKMSQMLPSPGYKLVWGEGGKLLATLLPDSIKVWDASSATLQTTIPVVNAASLAAAPDFASFVTGSGTDFAVHERATGKTLRRFDNLAGTAPPHWYAGKMFVTGLGSPKLTLWDADTGKSLRALEGHTAGISAVAVSPSGKTLATGAHDKTVRLWESATGKLNQTFTGHAAPVLAVAFASDGKLAASSSADKQVLVWDPLSAKLLHTLSGSSLDVTALAWKPGASAALLSNGAPTAVQHWNLRAGKVDKLFEANHAIVSLAWSPDGTRAAAGQDNGNVLIWHAASGKLLYELEQPGSPPQVSSLAWAPKGQALAAGRGNHTMQVWDPRSGKQFFSLPTMAPVERVSWTPSGNTIVVSSQDRTVRFFDAATGKLRGVLLAEDDQLMAVNHDGHYRAPAAEAELVYVVQTSKSQDTYTPSRFAAKFILKNAPTKVNLFGN